MMAYLDGYSGYSGVPEDAAAEILEKLMTHQQISSDEVAQILKRYGVRGEPEALQIAYRKKVGQRLIAIILLFTMPGSVALTIRSGCPAASSRV